LGRGRGVPNFLGKPPPKKSAWIKPCYTLSQLTQYATVINSYQNQLMFANGITKGICVGDFIIIIIIIIADDEDLQRS